MNKMSHKITLVYRIKDRIDMGFRIHIYSILFYPLFSLFFWRCLQDRIKAPTARPAHGASTIAGSNCSTSSQTPAGPARWRPVCWPRDNSRAGVYLYSVRSTALVREDHESRGATVGHMTSSRSGYYRQRRHPGESPVRGLGTRGHPGRGSSWFRSFFNETTSCCYFGP